jgi:hypothetical protein
MDNGTMKNIFNNKKLIDFWLIVQNYQNQLVEKDLIPYCTTFRCEKLFLTTITDADLRVKTSSPQPNLDEIMNKKEWFYLFHKVKKSMQ